MTRTARTTGSRRPTRIQRENTGRILDAALEAFSSYGYHGATLDRIAESAGLSKPNLLYYFAGKEEIHRHLLTRLLGTWLEPLRSLNADGDPVTEITGYVRRKLEMARDYPRESRLFANEIVQGAQVIEDFLKGELRKTVDDAVVVIDRWASEGKINGVDGHHLIFSIWATTQHYADFEVQVRHVLGREDIDFDNAAAHLDTMYRRLLELRAE